MIWVVIWVVLMMFWLLWGVRTAMVGTEVQPAVLGNVLIPWLCVLILGLVLFGAVSPGPIR